MKIDFGVYCLGYSVRGRDYPFEIEIDDNELEGMSEEEKMTFRLLLGIAHNNINV